VGDGILGRVKSLGFRLRSRNFLTPEPLNFSYCSHAMNSTAEAEDTFFDREYAGRFLFQAISTTLNLTPSTHSAIGNFAIGI
jgi:hypothetical protein